MKKYLNGREIPEHASSEQLSAWLHGTDMPSFCMACEILSEQNPEEAPAFLEPFLKSRDVYRCRYVLEVIFRLPSAQRLLPELDRFLCCNERLLVTTALQAAYTYKLSVSDASVLKAIRFLGGKIGEYDLLYACQLLTVSEKNYIILKTMYSSADYTPNHKRRLAEVMAKYRDFHFEELFAMFARHPEDQLRQIALSMAIDLQKQDRIAEFKNDKNGHIRKLCEKYSE